MGTVRDILRTKGNDIWSISPDTTVFEALQEMSDRNVGAILVMEAGKLVGILSERDYARKVRLCGKSASDTTSREIMTERVVCVRPEQTTEDCMALMTDKHVRHLPVIEENQVVGVVSIGDIVKNIISEQEFIIDQLENYISGTAYLPKR